MVTTTTVFTIIVIALLGNVLLTQVRDGLLDGEAAGGPRRGGDRHPHRRRRPSTRADRSEPAVYDTARRRTWSASSPAAAGRAGAREVVLLRGDDVTAPPGAAGPQLGRRRHPRGAAGAARAVETTDRQQWTYSEVTRASGRNRCPVMVVGSPVVVPRIGAYELYFLFPLDKEEETLGLVRARCSWPRPAC